MLQPKNEVQGQFTHQRILLRLLLVPPYTFPRAAYLFFQKYPLSGLHNPNSFWIMSSGQIRGFWYLNQPDGC